MAAKITVKNNGSIRVEGEFELYDIEGKLIKKLDIEDVSVYHLNVASFPSGQYKIITSSENQSAVRSFVKE